MLCQAHIYYVIRLSVVLNTVQIEEAETINSLKKYIKATVSTVFNCPAQCCWHYDKQALSFYVLLSTTGYLSVLPEDRS